MPLRPKQKVLYFQEIGQNAKWRSKSNLPLSHCPDRKILPFKKGFKKIKFVPITTVILTKINLQYLELLRPWGAQSQLPGGPRFT